MLQQPYILTLIKFPSPFSIFLALQKNEALHLITYNIKNQITDKANLIHFTSEVLHFINQKSAILHPEIHSLNKITC